MVRNEQQPSYSKKITRYLNKFRKQPLLGFRKIFNLSVSIMIIIIITIIIIIIIIIMIIIMIII